MRFLLLAFLAFGSTAAEPATPPPYPLWDGQETIAEYARRANLPPTKTLDLGNGVMLELVLIPAGTFTMGTPEPPPVDEEGFRRKILTGQVVLATGGGALVLLLSVVLIGAIRRRQRPQYSLAWFLAMTVAAGIGLMGGLHWWYSARALSEAMAEYTTASARYTVAEDGEKPGHQVTLTQPFYIGKYEVTQEQFQQILGRNLSSFKGRDLPAEVVSWFDASEFCRKASEKTGSAIRLPTEAEWEHACRAGTRTTYCSGDTEADLSLAGWYGGNSGGNTHPVGQKTPNVWGVYDMHGNVSEWCEDWHGEYTREAVTDPRNLSIDDKRVFRGGSWVASENVCASAGRRWYVPGYRDKFYGFRIAATPKQ